MEVVALKVSDLAGMASAYNPRTITDHDMLSLRRSLTTFGVVEPIVVNLRTNRVVGGHQRVKAAQAEGLDELPAVHVDLDELQEKQLNLALNRIHGDWDTDALVALLGEMSADDVALTGFGDDEVEALLRAEVQGKTDPDAVPEPPVTPHTQPGDLIVMGEHRLLCGDCTDRDSYAAVSPDRVNLVLTDPPYAIDLDYADSDDDEATLRNLADKFLPLARGWANAVVFTPGVTRQWFYPEPKWVMCWFYGGGQFRSSWGFNCWQPILAYGKDPMLARGMGARPDAVDMNTPSNSADINHPCPKPLKLWTWLVERCSIPGDVILDPFMGSGTTLIVAEQTGRIAHGIEISPTYCDVIVQRWQDFTGKTAEGWRGNP